jgi:hypothetical protein
MPCLPVEGRRSQAAVEAGTHRGDSGSGLNAAEIPSFRAGRLSGKEMELILTIWRMQKNPSARAAFSFGAQAQPLLFPSLRINAI